MGVKGAQNVPASLEARIRDVQEGVSGESSPSNRSGARVVQKNTNNNVTKREQRARTHISTLVGIK